MILTHQQSLARIHAIEQDFKTEISNAVVTTPARSGPSLRGWPKIISSFSESAVRSPSEEADSLGARSIPQSSALWHCEMTILFSTRLNILIHSEEIIRIVFGFDRNQPLVIIAVGFLHPFFAFVSHQKVHVRPTGGIWMNRIVI